MKNKYNFLIFCVMIISGLFVLSSCLNNTQHPLTGITQVVYLKSFFNEEVKKAFLADPLTRINATYLDLESNSVSTENENNMDIFYSLDCGSSCFPIVAPLKEVKIAGFGEQQPSKPDCKKKLRKIEAGSSTLAIKESYYSCIQTSEGRIGWIRYENDFNDSLEEGEIEFAYYLWDEIEKAD